MLNSAENEICSANKSKITNNYILFPVKHSCMSMEISLLIDMKMPTISFQIDMKMSTIVGIFIFISRENFMLGWVEHEKSFISSGPRNSSKEPN